MNKNVGNNNLEALGEHAAATVAAETRGALTSQMASSMTGSSPQQIPQTQSATDAFSDMPIQPPTTQGQFQQPQPATMPIAFTQMPSQNQASIVGGGAPQHAEHTGFFQFQTSHPAAAPPPGPPPGMPQPQHPLPWPQPPPAQMGPVENFDLNKWQVSGLRKIPSLSKFDGTTQHYRAWHMQLGNFMSAINRKRVPLLNMVRMMPYEIKESTFANTSMCMGLSGDNLRELSSVLWNVLSATLHELYLPQLQALSGGDNRNGFENFRMLHLYHGKGSMKQRVRGLRQLQRYPRCDPLENLEKELLNLKLLMQQFGSTMDAEHACVLFADFVPKTIEEALIKQNITTFRAALDFVEETLSRLNGDRLAEFEERRIQMSMHQGKPTVPFINSLTDDVQTQQSQQQPEQLLDNPAVQQLVAALQRKSPNPTQGLRAATWQGGACFECGSTSHSRSDCPEYIRLCAQPGGYPKDHLNEYSKWKKAQGLPPPGSRPPPRKGAGKGRPATVAAVQQPQQQQQPLQFPQQPQQPQQSPIGAAPVVTQDVKSILKTWSVVLAIPNDDQHDNSTCLPCEDDDLQLVQGCQNPNCGDHLCSPCIDAQQYPVLNALQATNKKKSMPRFNRGNQASRIFAPLTKEKIEAVEKTARTSQLHLPPSKPNQRWALGDSGATTCVADHEKHVQGAISRPSEASSKGISYQAADGSPNSQPRRI